ncbi:hypothetical protein MMC25_004890 [Agyrium rufum]|nr:hypothetical protein [Agyrium rufum]
MGILNPSFAVGIIILFYLLSFVLFAIIRIATGVSIQRIGYLSFRRIAYCPREGIRIDIRGLGLRFHRPTFAQPTWISLRLNELKVTVNVKGLAQPIRGKKKEKHTRNKDAGAPQGGGTEVIEDGEDEPGQGQTDRSRTWKQLTHLKEQIKSIHGKIHWIRIFDLEVLNASCVISDVASVQLGLLSLAVDTRRKTVDRGRLFRHKKVTEGTQRPAEWLLSLKGILFTPHGRDSMEILDICSMNVHGLLYRDLEGLRDVSISLKLGRVHLPYDDIIQCQMRIQSLQSALPQRSTDHNRNVSFTAVVEELDMPHSNDDLLVQTVSDSKEFISSLLRGIQEIQMAVSSVGLSKEIQRLKPEDPSLYINLVMNEFGIDLYRLDPKSPAHRMYFSPKDIAHQALLAAISIAVSVDDGRGKPERLLYVPMATTTIKTTLPSRTLAQSEDKDAAERNANILFANSVVTSPSIDLDLRHLPIALGLLQGVPQTSQRKPASDERRHHIISRLLPKASIKFSIQEPVARLVLPPIDSTTAGPEEYDLLISAISSISMDLESSHAAAGELHYALAATLRASSYEFYYQSAHGVRHNLLLADALELKGQLAATPAVNISMFGHAETFSIHLIHPELSKGLHQVVRQVRSNPRLGKSTSSLRRKRLNFLRRLSPTITQFQFQGSNFGVQIAGVDAGVSKDVRGAAFQVESWTVDYKLRKDIPAPKRFVSQRATSGSQSGDESFQRFDQGLKYATEPPESTDGRRVAIHVKGLEGFIVEGTDACESEPFVSLPRFEVAFSTSSDQRGHIFHVNTHLKALHVQYSLYCYYALGVANFVLQSLTQLESTHEHHSEPTAPKLSNEQVGHDDELVTFDIKAAMFQVKAKMPSDPPIMLRVWGLEAGRHRWAVPFLKSRVIRMYTETPHIRSTWSKIVGIKSLRVDLRESKRKVGKDYVQEQSIDVVTDFVRIGVPHQLVVHRIFDNFVNVAKATQQLHHRFQTGTNEYILHKGPEKPKRVPHISIRSKALNFQLEDGVFDWKIGMIYRCGLVEQKQRLAREEAYHAKLKKVNENGARRGSSRFRTQSAHPTLRGRSLHPNPDRRTERSKSDGSRSRGKSPIPTEHRGRRMRYDPEAAFIPSSSAQISIDEAFDKLTQYHSQSWKSRIDQVLRFHKKTMQTIRGLYGGDEDLPEPYDDSEVILTIPHRPGLMSTLLSDIHITVGNPSFPLEGYPEFLHAMGKGIPKDMKYGLLVPMGIQINMGESRMMLRDYPLPLLHIPPLRAGQSSRLPCWSVKTDFVIAEEFRDSESIKHVKVMVVPPEKITSPPTVKNGFGIDVRRTVSPVKTYSNVDISINTANPTSITWGTSYQPAIQDMMQIIENFTKPQVDPSERCGFWDKIRLGVHSRIRVVWKGDGDVHFKLKGSRSPYVVTGYGAGFVMCFRNNVRWEIHNEDDPRKFMTVSSGEYVLAIPDYSHEARKDISTTQSDTDSISSSITNVKNNAMFKKTIMKLSGNVRWVAGLVFERDVGNGKRSFESVPHYQVTLKTPAHAKGTIDEASQCKN